MLKLAGYVSRRGRLSGVADWHGETDQWWAETLGLPTGAMHAGGVFPASHFDHVGIVAVAGAAAPVVYGPPSARPALRHMLEHTPSAGALDAGHLAALLGR